MKFATLLVLSSVALSLAEAAILNRRPIGTEKAFFARSWQDLFRGPPVLPFSGRAIYSTEWIEQKLDHFNDSETRTWQMRYMINDRYFVDGGPMFIYVGGEWQISPLSILTGHFPDMAKEHNGILFYTEHRFYGESRPLEDITVESLQYLHVKQALADLAHFIRHQRATNPALANSKVIMAGGSYAATMVVWFKRLYPDLLDGGWASSAPIQAKINFIEYKEVVGRAIRELGSEACYNRIQNGFAGLEQMIAERRGAELKAMLQLCNNFDETNDLDVWSLFGGLSNIYSGLVQYQREGDVPRVCDQLMSYESDEVAIASYALVKWGNSQCIDASYQDTVDYYEFTDYTYGASRPWYYQTCNEYGWYQTSESLAQPFGKSFPVDLYLLLCGDAFGSGYHNESIYQNAEQTNFDFGGMQPQVENVFMTHGALDPWNPMGHGEPEGATVIPRASHCADFGSITSRDSPEMRATKERIAQLVREWLAN